MFNLDQSIATWRREMAAGGLDSPEVVAELESHLRDALDEQPNPDEKRDARKIFEAAVGSVGSAIALREEFRKAKLNQPMKLETHKLLRKILTLIAVFATGLGLVLPAVAKWGWWGPAGRELGAPAGVDITLFSIGAVAIAFALLCGLRCAVKRLKA